MRPGKNLHIYNYGRYNLDFKYKYDPNISMGWSSIHGSTGGSNQFQWPIVKLYNCVCNVIYTDKRYCNLYVRGLVYRANSTFVMGMRQVVSNILGLY